MKQEILSPEQAVLIVADAEAKGILSGMSSEELSQVLSDKKVPERIEQMAQVSPPLTDAQVLRSYLGICRTVEAAHAIFVSYIRTRLEGDNVSYAYLRNVAPWRSA